MHTPIFKSLLGGFFSVFLLGFMAVSQAAETGLLWKMEAPNGTVSHVFGTIHVDDPRVTDFSPALVQALQDSEIFMMEALPPSDSSIYFVPDYKLRDELTEQEWQKVMELAELHAMSEEMVLHMKPWLLAMIFDLPKSQSPYTQDILLFARAQQQSKQIFGLEDMHEHFTLLDSFSREEQLTMLRSVLKRSQQEKERDFENLLNAYLKGDAAVIAAIDEEVTGDMLPPELWDRMRVKLIDERNALMAERIAEKAKDNSLFVAVGAAHLAGEEGILARLRKAGYKVMPVK